MEELIDKDKFSKELKDLGEEKQLCISNLAELEKRDYSWVNENTIIEFLLGSKERLESQDDKLKRKVIETFLDKVVIYNDKIEATFKLDALISKDTERGKVGSA